MCLYIKFMLLNFRTHCLIVGLQYISLMLHTKQNQSLLACLFGIHLFNAMCKTSELICQFYSSVLPLLHSKCHIWLWCDSAVHLNAKYKISKLTICDCSTSHLCYVQSIKANCHETPLLLTNAKYKISKLKACDCSISHLSYIQNIKNYCHMT